MATGSRQRAHRQQALKAQGAAHPHPEAVADPLFRDGAFFDPNDLVQVKYEMLRSVEKDGRAVVEAAEAFGLSRPVYYVTRELFSREGLPGLLPRKRGPKRPHKLTEENLAVLAQAVRKTVQTDRQRATVRAVGAVEVLALSHLAVVLTALQFPDSAAALWQAFRA